MRQVNKATLDLIKSFEGVRLSPYQDIVGVYTIGYGSTKGVTSTTPSITLEQASQLLMKDLAVFEVGVSKLVKVELTDNEYGSLVSFAFNLGLGNLSKSTLLNCINLHNKQNAANEFLKWNRAGRNVIPGLTRRREAEKALFLTT